MIVEPSHFGYLRHQHGVIAHEAGDFERWKRAYVASLQAIYDSIVPVLPVRARSVLDVGSGLGGIDVFLHRHYAGAARVVLLDGDMAPPEVVQAARPHNDVAIAQDFQRKNGVTPQFCLPGYLGERQPGEFDLVVSFAAYGFHIAPEVYLDDLLKVTHERTVVVLDVRKRQRKWMDQLVAAFGDPRVLVETEKGQRVAFHAP